MTEHPNSTLAPCPLCKSPHVNLARNLKGDAEQTFCKVCGCSAPCAAWHRRPPATEEGGVLPHQNAEDHGCRERASDKWQPISTAPKDGTTIIGWPVCGRGVPKERPMERPVEHGGLRAAVGEAPDLGPGLALAIKLIEKRRESFIRENCKSVGNSGDWEGTVAQDEYISELDDIIELFWTARGVQGTGT